MTLYAILFTLAATGISQTVYLIRKRRENERPVCIIGEGCGVVLSSKYNRIFGVHNDLLGLLFYIVVSVITAFLVIGVEPVEFWSVVMKISIAGAALMSIFLLFLQFKVIKTWCFWCVMSSITIFVMEIIILLPNFKI